MQYWCLTIFLFTLYHFSIAIFCKKQQYYCTLNNFLLPLSYVVWCFDRTMTSTGDLRMTSNDRLFDALANSWITNMLWCYFESLILWFTNGLQTDELILFQISVLMMLMLFWLEEADGAGIWSWGFCCRVLIIPVL